MAAPLLTIDLDAIATNWRALDRASASGVQTAAVVKADAYGLGLGPVIQCLAQAGARRFFVASAEEGSAARDTLGPGPQIYVLSGHMQGDTALIRDADLTPVLSSLDQVALHLESLPGQSFAIHLDTGMNRQGLEEAEWDAAAPFILDAGPEMLMSHLACADDPDHGLNEVQLANFHAMTDGTGLPRSFSATGGILLGPAYHFDLTRPGIGLFGGRPYDGGARAVSLALPVIQTRLVTPGEAVGYSATFVTDTPMLVATVLGGYADGLPRTLSNTGLLWAGEVPCPILGRISMDAITVDVSHLTTVPDMLSAIGPMQSFDQLADSADTIGYEILTCLGARHKRRYLAGRPSGGAA